MAMDLMCGSNICAINVIGDPAWVLRALEGLAMLTDSGNVARVAAIGLLVGLIATALKAILTGGEKFELQNLLAGYILYMALFVPTVNVQIDPLVIRTGYVECGGGCRVDNIPIGAAATGVLISNLGYGIAKGFEQAFGTWVSTDSQLTQGGFGNGLEAIAAFRNLDQEYINSAGTTEVGQAYDAFRKTLKHYLHDCTLTKLMLGRTTSNAIFGDPNPLEAIIFDDGWATTLAYITASRQPINAPVALTCRAAGERITAYAPSDGEIGGALQLTDLANAALAARTGTNDVSTKAQEFFSVLGAGAAINMNQYTASSMIYAVFNEAMLQGPLSSERIAQTIMLQQGSEQRATQWAAEETMFRRVVTPVISFFEGFLYVVMPFMAFLLGFGAAGIGLALKLLQTAIWIQLFAPILAAINLFQVTSMQSYARRLGELNIELGRSEGDWTSITAVGQLQAEAIDWLGVGSMLAAATPAISLMILYGGAVAATHLAGRLQGGDHINEKQVSPDAFQPAASLQMGPMSTFNPTQGTVRGGSQQMSFSVESGVQSALSARTSSAQSASNSLSHAVGEAHRDTTGFSQAYESAYQASLKNMSQSAMDAGYRAAEAAGYSRDDLNNMGVKGADVIKTAIGMNGNAGGGFSGATKAALSGVGKLLSGLSGAYNEESSVQNVREALTRISDQISATASSDSGFKATMVSEQARVQSEAAKEAATQTMDKTNSEQMTRTADQVSSESAALDRVLAASNSAVVRSNFTAAEFAQLHNNPEGREALDVLDSKLGSMGLGDAINRNMHHAKTTQGIQDPDNQRAAALLMTAAGEGPGVILSQHADPGQMLDAEVYAYSLMGYGSDVQELFRASVADTHQDNLLSTKNENINEGDFSGLRRVDADGAVQQFNGRQERSEADRSAQPALNAPKSVEEVTAQSKKAREDRTQVLESSAQSELYSETVEQMQLPGGLPGSTATGVSETVHKGVDLVTRSPAEQIKDLPENARQANNDIYEMTVGPLPEGQDAPIFYVPYLSDSPSQNQAAAKSD